jgi:hypothetical protein
MTLHASKETLQRLIIGTAIDELLLNNFEIAVCDRDSPNFHLNHCDDCQTIVANIFPIGDLVTLDITNRSDVVGWMHLQLQNGVDVISDYTTNLEPFIAKANNLARALDV